MTGTTKYTYETVAGDPLGVKIYTLKNGLKVYMSVNKDAPRIQTFVAVRTGSKNDPSDATGLAHYLEHMVFKGTSKLGALDWEKEKVLLAQISDLYEQHRNAWGDEEKRKEIYKKIDELSSQAALYVSANEYDRLISTLGAKGTNAYTSMDQTVYVNDIPSNELEKWLRVESERFSELVLRLFHTELEAVYEEFNISQNRDGRKVFTSYMNALLPNHPYGTQTTIGTGEHLKKPSMVKIHEYFNKYYVPNNMAIILSGDFDPDQAVTWVEQYFGQYESKTVPEKVFPTQPKMEKAIVREVIGKEKAVAQRVWALPGVASNEAMLAELCSHLLSNGKAGLIDINLVQKQFIGESSGAYSWGANDYSFFGLYADPRPGQTLEDAVGVMQEQLSMLKAGKFEEWMLEAIINNLEYEHIKRMEENNSRADFMLDAFLYKIEWAKQSAHFEEMRKVTKDQLVAFANTYLGDNNHVTVYKREGEETPYAVDKPSITPVKLHRDTASNFKKEVDKLVSPRQKPVFVDFAKSIKSKSLMKGVDFHYLKNVNNATFELYYILDMGSENDALIDLVARYLPYLGTSKYTAEELQKEFFKLGLDYSVRSSADVTYITLSGLERSAEKGIELLEHILSEAKADEPAWKELIEGMLKERNDAKKNKGVVLNRAMFSYARYGAKSPFTDQLSEAELKKLSASDIVARIKQLTQYPHEIFYYGSQEQDAVTGLLNKHHKLPAQLLALPARKQYAELDTDKDRVIFVNFKGLAQAEILMVSKGTPQFNLNEYIYSQLYNDYFGAGLSSIVFQEIRESRALAYSAYAFSSPPSEKDKAHYFRAFVGTQVDKVKDAIPAMKGIIEDMPVVEEQIKNAADAALKKIESERIIKDNVYWSRRAALKRGLDRDVRRDVYEVFNGKDQDKMLQDFLKFQKETIKGRKYTTLVLADKEKIDTEYLKTLGDYQELSLEDVFGY